MLKNLRAMLESYRPLAPRVSDVEFPKQGRTLHIVRGSHKSRPHSYTRPPPSGARPSIRWSLTAELDGCPLVLLSARNMAAVPTGALQGKEVLWEGR